MALYLLHFDPAYPGGQYPQHYFGWTTDGKVEKRVLMHLNGQGSPLVRAAVEIGCDVRVARVWPKGNRTKESQIKKQLRTKGYSSICPICQGLKGGELYDGQVQHQQEAGQPSGFNRC